MAIKDKADYEAWVQEVLGKVTPEQAEVLKGVFGSPTGEELFGGHLREKDYYTRLNRMNEESKKQADDLNKMYAWFNEAQPQYQSMASQLAEAKKARQEAEERLKTVGVPADEAFERANKKFEQDLLGIKQQLAFIDQASPALASKLAKMSFQAAKEGLDFDPDAILDTARRTGLPLEQAYDRVAEPVRKERESKRQQEALEAAKEAGRKEALSKLGTPDAPKPKIGTVSPLFSHLDNKGGNNPSLALRDEAVKAYLELTS